MAGVTAVSRAADRQFIQCFGGSPETIGRKGRCGVLSVILQANLRRADVATRLAVRPPIPGAMRHFYLRTLGAPGTRICIDRTWQQYLPSEQQSTEHMPDLLVCPENELLDVLAGYGVPEHRLNLWSEARDTAITWRYFGLEELASLFAELEGGSVPAERIAGMDAENMAKMPDQLQ